MNSVFADTSFCVAFLSRRDRFHDLANELMLTLQARMVTTDWVVVEIANFMAKTPLRAEAANLIRRVQANPRMDIVPASAAAIEEGLKLYEQYADKAWSLTDCISFRIMRNEQLSQALTADHHFEQAGFEILLR